MTQESAKLSGDSMLEHEPEKCETIFGPDCTLLIRPPALADERPARESGINEFAHFVSSPNEL
jgi:hypothetical protein